MQTWENGSSGPGARLVLTQREAAQALGLVPSALSQYESGKRRIDVITLDRLSHLYGLPVAALIAERPQRPDWEASLRAQAEHLSAAGKIGVGRLIGHLRDLEELYRWESRGTSGSSPFCPLPPLSEHGPVAEDADLWAERTRWHANLGSAPLPDLRSFLETQGYQIFAVPLGREPGDLSGISLQHPEWGPILIVNSDQPYDQWPTALAHQLAHCLFHDDRPVVLCRAGGRPRERFAERYADFFLIPRGALRDALSSDALPVTDPRQIVRLARYFGVNYLAMRRRLEDEAVVGPPRWKTPGCRRCSSPGRWATGP